MNIQRVINPEHLDTARKFSERFNIPPDIHHADFIYWFDYDNAPEDKKPLIALHYAEGGRATAHLVKDFLSLHAPSRPDFSILDFASGYGRVTRWFKEAFPQATVFGSDIHEPAVEFMRGLGLNAIQSTTDPDMFDPGMKFDVIWALSFFTHMPKRTFRRWLAALSRCLNSGGVLVFTTHGTAIWPLIGRPALDAEGFHFDASSEQKDLDTQDYGGNCTAPSYVLKQLNGLPLRLEGLRSPGIGHHDVWILRATSLEDMPKIT